MFNLIRAVFQLFPYRFLDLNHEILAIPLALSVPVIAASIQLYLYLTYGTLCSEDPVIQLHYKLNININSNTTTALFTKSRPDIVLGLIIISAEIFLRMYGQYKRIRSNRVVPFDNIEARPADTERPKFGYIYHFGPFPAILSVAIISFILMPEDFNPQNIIGSIFNDLLLLGLSFYWVTSSDEIKTFLKMKFNKLKVRLGFYDI